MACVCGLLIRRQAFVSRPPRTTKERAQATCLRSPLLGPSARKPQGSIAIQPVANDTLLSEVDAGLEAKCQVNCLTFRPGLPYGGPGHFSRLFFWCVLARGCGNILVCADRSDGEG